MMQSHPSSCFNAKSNTCHCECGGKLHGRKSGNITEEMQNSLRGLAVGDIVIIRSDSKAFGKKGFVEEIIRDPMQRAGTLWSHGKYSIYGFDFVESAGSKSRYYGDHISYELEPTDGKMTSQLVKEWASEEPNNKGLQKDAQIIIDNLGRKKGKNEGRDLKRELVH